jgi:hypothetical protein
MLAGDGAIDGADHRHMLQRIDHVPYVMKETLMRFRRLAGTGRSRIAGLRPAGPGDDHGMILWAVDAHPDEEAPSQIFSRYC